MLERVGIKVGDIYLYGSQNNASSFYDLFFFNLLVRTENKIILPI